MTTSYELVTASDPALAGTLHVPDDEAVATVVMVPGSGPTDRDNDTYFLPIRTGLLAAGIAVASFDKRGVGASTGDWHDTDAARQADDVARQVARVRDVSGLDPARVGLFGHSQGGWVVLEVAAEDPTVAFVVTNSGPGVTWARQGRYATAAHLAADGATPDAIASAVESYDVIVDLMRGGATFDELDRAGAASGLAGSGPADAAELELARMWLDHDPRGALERIAAPILALFGGADRVVPVDESLAVFRSARADRPDALTAHVFPGGDHRIRVGDPPALHPDYLEVLTGWIRATCPAASSAR